MVGGRLRGHAARRPFAVCQPWEHLRSAVQEPSPYHRLVLLAARTGGRVVGTALLGLSLRDNLHLVDLQISVLPGRRRQGIGSQLYDAASARLGAEGRTTIVGEANTPADGDDGAVAFARSLGFESVHTEHHLWLPLPVEPDQVAQLRGRVDHLAGGYDVLTWGNRCPQEYVAASAPMASQMSTDAPYGRIDWEPVRLDEERLRAEETRTAGAYDRVVAVARRRSDRAFAATRCSTCPETSATPSRTTPWSCESTAATGGAAPQADHARHPAARSPRAHLAAQLDLAEEPRDAAHQPRVRLHPRGVISRDAASRCGAGPRVGWGAGR